MKLEIIEQEYRGVITKVVFITNDDGTTLSMTKERWDELEAQREQSGTL